MFKKKKDISLNQSHLEKLISSDLLTIHCPYVETAADKWNRSAFLDEKVQRVSFHHPSHRKKQEEQRTLSNILISGLIFTTRN